MDEILNSSRWPGGAGFPPRRKRNLGFAHTSLSACNTAQQSDTQLTLQSTSILVVFACYTSPPPDVASAVDNVDSRRVAHSAPPRRAVLYPAPRAGSAVALF